jgi:hypothetical protein
MGNADKINGVFWVKVHRYSQLKIRKEEEKVKN